jgi:hypothetical protein
MSRASAAEELLDDTLLLSLGQAREIIAAWLMTTTPSDPHSSLGTPYGLMRDH